MPVIDLQRRMRQLGEIRLGHVVATSNGKTRPEKLDKFRFTSPSRENLESVAAEYGGEVKEWTPANGGMKEWEVYTEATRLPVIVPPAAITQWYELYQGSRCVRRCDGQTENKSDRPCMCDPEQRDCTLTTRLNVMLRDVPPLAYWLLTSHGYYAAVELPPIAELLARGGGNVPGWLGVEERRIVREKPNGGSETVRFMVPTLDIAVAPAELLAGRGRIAVEAGNDAPALPGAPTPELTAGPEQQQDDAPADAAFYRSVAEDAVDLETVQQAWRDAKANNVLDDDLAAYLQQRARDFAPPKADQAVEGDGDGPDADAVWLAIVSAAGERDWTTPQVNERVEARFGKSPDECNGWQLAEFLDAVKSGEVK
jgi:hypothetical protein